MRLPLARWQPITGGSAKKTKSATHGSPSQLEASNELFKALDATELECEVLPLPSHPVATSARTAEAGVAKVGAAKARPAKGAANGKAKKKK